MKIALVIEHLDPSRGGRETSTVQVARGLAKRGQEVCVICQTALWGDQTVEVRQLGSKGSLPVRRLLNFITEAQGVVKTGQWDIVHAMLPIPGANVYQPRGGTIPAQVASRSRGKSWPVRMRIAFNEQLKVRRRIMGRLEKQIAGDPAVLILAVSRMVAQEFKEYYRRTENVRVTYNGVDVPDASPTQRAQWRRSQRQQWGIGPDDFVVLTVANNFALKGAAEAIRAFARWQASGRTALQARLVVVGHDKPAGYRKLAGELGVEGQVIFPGPSEDIFGCYAAADGCMLLSWYDPCSRVILEAARWGIPAITTKYNGAVEMLGEAAAVVKSPDDIEAAAAALNVLADTVERDRLSQQCRKIAWQLSMERQVEQLLEAYTARAI